MGQIGIVGVAARCRPNFPADRTGSTAKAFSNVTDTAPVVEHGHYNGSFLSGQVGINSWHGSTLQEKVLHLVLEAAVRCAFIIKFFFITSDPFLKSVARLGPIQYFPTDNMR